MLIIFEILREAGTRIPSDMGQAVSIVGALVLGQAAVEARIVSAPIVIVVGLTGIVALLNIKMKGVNLFLRFIFLFLASFMGLYGIVFGIIGVLIYTMGLSSFGVPYMLKVGTIKMENIKDTFIRSPWWYLNLNSYKVSVKTTLKGKKIGTRDEK
ncbi:Spore germination protein A1 [compost metagenome]